MQTITEPIADILKNGRVDGDIFFLPDGQLDRPTYTAVNKVLSGLGGKWDRKIGGHTFPFNPEDALNEALETGGFESRQQKLQLFETPADLATHMAELACLMTGSKVLEPSAGPGRLARAAICFGATVEAVEIDKINCGKLGEIDGVTILHEGDFLGVVPDERFDAVLMNPPFAKGQDIGHIMHAFDFLKDGGKLIAICGEGAFFHESHRAVEFRRWLEAVNAHVEKLPAGTFKESGTSVNTRLVIIHK